LARFLRESGDGAVALRSPKEGDVQAILDAQVLATLRSLDSDPAGFAHLVDTYLREATNSITTIVLDGVSGRRDGLAERAHAMKGAALTIGLTRLAKALDLFEGITFSGDDNALASAATDLEQVFAEGSAALRMERDRSPRPSTN
jgi:HPt (histidine-containing phosphotransfer) domain-containing protein